MQMHDYYRPGDGLYLRWAALAGRPVEEARRLDGERHNCCRSCGKNLSYYASHCPTQCEAMKQIQVISDLSRRISAAASAAWQAQHEAAVRRLMVVEGPALARWSAAVDAAWREVRDLDWRDPANRKYEAAKQAAEAALEAETAIARAEFSRAEREIQAEYEVRMDMASSLLRLAWTLEGLGPTPSAA